MADIKISTTGRFQNKDVKPIDYTYGPWDSFLDFASSILKLKNATDDKYLNWIKNTLPVGITIGINEKDEFGNIINIVEYWKPSAGQGFVRKVNQIDSGDLLMDVDSSEDGDFITVTGVTVGGLSSGDKIKKKESLEQVLRKILQKEINVKSNLPTVNLIGYPSNTNYEIGETVSGNLSHKYNDGSFTGLSGYTYSLNAGCSEVSATYSPSKEYSVTIVPGSNTFSVNVKYDASINKPKTNLGNYSTVTIGASSCSDSKTVYGKYKIWYGELAYDSISIGETDTNIISKFGSNKWISKSGDNITVGDIKINDNKSYYFYVPSNYKVSGTSLAKDDSNAISVTTTTHELSNKETVSYTLYFYKVSGASYTSVHIF